MMHEYYRLERQACWKLSGMERQATVSSVKPASMANPQACSRVSLDLHVPRAAQDTLVDLESFLPVLDKAVAAVRPSVAPL